jgi:hypothetical protein
MRIKIYHGARIKSGVPDPFRKSTEGVRIIMLPEGTSEGDIWKLGGCPRCHGDVFLDSEAGELLGHCLQCGYVGTNIVTPAPKID